MTARPIHLFEPTGFGGIFQHTCALADLLTQAGHQVTLHTARQHEPVSLSGGRICRCVSWPRDRSHTGVAKLCKATRLVVKTVPHLHQATGRGSLVHIQGGIASGALTALTLGVAHRRGRAVVYSPHNMFSRHGWFDALMLRACLAIADSSVGYSQIDVAILRSCRVHAELSPLIMLVPEPAEARVSRWRRIWGAGPDDDVVLFAGVVRPDKRLDLLVRAARGWPLDRRLAVVGQDRGELEACRALAEELGVDMHAHDEFVALEDFTAALRAADVVVAPYERASQSAVLSVASQLGTATIGSDVGGLAELADRTFPSGDPAALAGAIEATLAENGRGHGRRPLDDGLALAAHEAAYRHAAGVRSRQRRRGAGRPPVAVVVWGPIEGRAREFADELGGDWRVFFDLGITRRGLVPLRYTLSAVRTAAYLLHTRPRALMVANPPIFAAIIGVAYARAARVPVVLDSHPMAFGEKGSRVGRFFLPMHAALARRASATIVGTDALAAQVRRWGGRPIIVHEAPPAALRPIGDVPPPLGARPKLLWTGIFAVDEPIAAVIEAAALLPDVDVLVAGDLRRCPIDPQTAPANVRWLGFLSGDAFAEALHDADIVLALTDSPTSAMRAAAEAVYAGKPLVTSDLEHLAELFAPSTRVHGSPQAIAAGVRSVLADWDLASASCAPARETQLARWNDQVRTLRERLGLDPTTAMRVA